MTSTASTTYQVATEELLNRVVTSRELVSFSAADPFGHLSTCRYLEFFVNHRVSAIEEEIGFVTMAMAREQKVGLHFSHAELRYLRPAFLGEKLGISSWAHSIQGSGFRVSGIIYGLERRDVKAVINGELRSVSLVTGKPTDLPATFPATSETRVRELPLVGAFLGDFKGIPEGFFEA
jgi:acyl-CoA thioesterase FadM